MLKTLYDEEYLREIHIKNLLRENTEEVTEKVTTEVTEKVTAEVTEKVTTEVTEAVTSEVTDTRIRSAVKMLRGMDMSSEEITAKIMEMFDIDETQAVEYVE